MSLPVFLADSDLTASRVVLTGPEGRHAATVRRLRTGELVELVDGHGTRARCAVVAVGRDTVELAVEQRVVEPVPRHRLVLVQALPKGERGELAVELATEVGVDEVVPWTAARCVMQWKGERGDKALGRWRATAREAAKQARRSRVPEVADLATTREVAARLAAAATGVVLHEAATAPLVDVPLPDGGEVVVVVGPEGGLTDDELGVLAAPTVRLGPTVLRTSTAGAAALAVLSARAGRWS